MRNFQLVVGGIPIVIESKDSSFVQLIAEKYQAFASTGHSLSLRDNYSSDLLPDDPPFQLFMNIRQVKEEKRSQMLKEQLWVKVFYQSDKFFIRRPDLEGEIDVAHRVARVTNRAAIYSFDSFLRILYSLLLVQEGGFLLHAASVVRDGTGYIFMGRSGAGKTTIAKHSTQYTVLSDEISLVRKSKDRYVLYSTPFWGEMKIKGGNFFSPIQGIYQLRQSPRLASDRMPAKESMCRLMENILYFAREPFLTGRVFQNCWDFIHCMDFYELQFQKDNHFWGAIN